jgi:hypothetical protein
MPKFIIERDVPGIGDWPQDKVNEIVNKSRAAIKTTSGNIQWVESFLTKDKVFSFYIAPDDATLQDFLKLSPLPPGPIHRVLKVADPAYGE